MNCLNPYTYAETGLLRPVHTGNKLLPEFVAENGNRNRQQIVAENGNILLPFSATICYRFWKQFVAVFGNKVSVPATICCRKWQQSCQCGQAFREHCLKSEDCKLHRVAQKQRRWVAVTL